MPKAQILKNIQHANSSVDYQVIASDTLS